VVNFLETGLGSGAIFYPGAPNDPDSADNKIPRLFATVEEFAAQGWQTFHCGLDENHASTCNFLSKINDSEYISEGVWVFPDFSEPYLDAGALYSNVGFRGVPTSSHTAIDTLSPDPVINWARADETGCCRVPRPLQVGLRSAFNLLPFPDGLTLPVNFYDLSLGVNTGTFPAEWPWPSDYCRITITATYHDA
jgi:hypothetical protein